MQRGPVTSPWPQARTARARPPQYSLCCSCMKTRTRPPAWKPTCCGEATKSPRTSSSSASAVCCLSRKCVSLVITWSDRSLCRGHPGPRWESSSSCVFFSSLFGCFCCCVCLHTSQSFPPSSWVELWATWGGEDSIRDCTDSDRDGVVLVCPERDFLPRCTPTNSLSSVIRLMKMVRFWHWNVLQSSGTNFQTLC